MSLYELPPEPLGPVWDKDGRKWWINESFRNWTDDGMSYRPWSELLWVFGPLTDAPPAPKAGDTVTMEQFADLPYGSIAVTDTTSVYVVGYCGVSTNGQSGVLNTLTYDEYEPLTLLRYVRGDDA